MRVSRLIVLALALAAPVALAQRHSGSSSPPTAPPGTPARPANGPQAITPASSGMGAIQFVAVNYGVPAPQSLTRQLRSDDDRTRAAALSAVGVPSQYLQRGHTGMPHSIQLEFADLGSSDDLDAMLTVEMDQHIVTAILMPDGDNWRRIATVFVADTFQDPRTTPATFAHTTRSLLQQDRYQAVFRALATDNKGNYTENEAHLRIFNNRAVITMNFASGARDCTSASVGKRTDAAGGCNIVHRWLQPDPTDPAKHFTLVTATGHLSAHEAADPLGTSRAYEDAHLRNFSCQPFLFSDVALRFEPTAISGPCMK
ncbi:hypothetical protein [Granulicella mallensis]|uniref:Secreted protein n=1 Tax=Granulicella mallensis (strain ATCC BAA-1857 / DSM 23137 / MP5ACTX8) TaxID=682795 RepID=G8P196_GRAMM|nr:hypothetical protein [Granulicella mallensis]AEU38114.1 hypothetical protein AciX8_3830 [Granulicella mallensis MP5ACTX8]